MLGKSPEAFRTISEVAKDLSVPKHVLRFWEGKFTQLRPMKRGGGRRYYRPEDVDLLKGIRQLLYSDGYTIKGVQKILREQGVRFVMDYWDLASQGDAVVLRDIPDLASETARSTVEPYVPSGSQDQGEQLSEGQAVELRRLLGDLEECRKILADAKK